MCFIKQSVHEQKRYLKKTLKLKVQQEILKNEGYLQNSLASQRVWEQS